VYRIILALVALFFFHSSLAAQVQSDIVFVTQPPFPADFATVNSTFANHRGDLDAVPRGGDLYIRYQDGTLKNLTAAAGFGSSGFQGASSIAVRDPFPHFDGTKVAFSMLIGAPTQRYQVQEYYWQLYEITNLGKAATPVITKVPNQPAEYNNIMPAYGSDGRIIFVSDRPRNGARHLYPQRDEYESTDTNTGVWSLNPATGSLVLLDHAPSGDFNPFVDSFGRIIFTRWDHLQRDQQAGGLTTYGAFNYSSESENADKIDSVAEVFPEIRSEREREREQTPSRINLHSFNHFFPWMLNQDGTEHETLNHIGRHELHDYFDRSFNDDSNLEEFFDSGSRVNKNSIFSLHQIREDPTRAGYYFGVDAPEFSTHAAGQIVALYAPPHLNPDLIEVEYITHRDTSSYTDSPSVNHSGLYRNPLPLSDGKLVAVHTTSTQDDENTGTRTLPQSRYDFRIKLLSKIGDYFKPAQALTSGINKSISYYDPDELVSYNGPLWELQPVELRPSTVPPHTSGQLAESEADIFQNAGVNLDEFRQYLRDSDLALMVVRDVTTRDRNDLQQPFNLNVPGGVQSISAPGKQYSVLDMQIFQGDQIRGYGLNTGVWQGRRILANPLHEGGDIALTREDSPVGSVEIAIDGSLAAFVPASRALTWQLLDTNAEPVVRERYWLTFAAGEIRVCGSCHGVNSGDQLNRSAPTNAPQALADLLAVWKGSPRTVRPRYDIKLGKLLRGNLQVGSLKAGGRGQLLLDGVNSASKNKTIDLKLSLAGRQCSTGTLATNETGDATRNFRLPKGARGRLTLALEYQGQALGSAEVRIKALPKAKRWKAKQRARFCRLVVN
jgi:hypothetical protein